MATLTICFTGICTHLRDFIDGAHRVVLIHETRDVIDCHRAPLLQ